ncbi:MAG TPA: 2-dehydropantoate 2-reductase [Anaerolineae bacterium]
MSRLKVMVIGAGAMGSLFGGRLALAGHQVTLIDVWQEHIDAINARGLTLNLVGETHVARCAASRPNDFDGPVDFTILFTKSHQSRAALAGLAQAIRADTPILTLQNGLGNIETIAEWVAHDQIIAGTTTFPSGLEGPGQIRSPGAGQTRIMTISGQRTQALAQIAAALDQAGLNCDIDENVEATTWEKVAFNAALNALTAVAGSPVKVIADSDYGRDLAAKVVTEVLSVARAKGIPVNAAAVEASIAMALRDHREHQPSMLQDLLAGRCTEIDSINGAVARQAAELNIPIPVTETLWRLVKLIESSRVAK